jgi:hypothetical protein
MVSYPNGNGMVVEVGEGGIKVLPKANLRSKNPDEHIVYAEADQLELLSDEQKHWTEGPGPEVEEVDVEEKE